MIRNLDAASAPALVGLPDSREMPWPAGGSWIAFSDDGRIVTVADGGMTVWDTHDLSVDSRTPLPTGVDSGGGIPSPDGRRLTVPHFRPGSVTWDVVERSTGMVLGSAELSYQNHVRATISPDSSAQAILAGDGQVAVFGVGQHPGHLRLLSSAGKRPESWPEFWSLNAWFSPDGARLLVVRTFTGEPSARATVFDVASGRHHDLDVPVGVSMLSAAWSPDGRVVAFAAPDGRANSSNVVLVDSRTGKQIDGTLSLQNTTFTSIAFAQSGHRIVALAQVPEGPGAIRMWDADGLLPIGDPIPVDPTFGASRREPGRLDRVRDPVRRLGPPELDPRERRGVRPCAARLAAHRVRDRGASVHSARVEEAPPRSAL